MSNAISSFGTLLKIGDGAEPTENFTTIAEVLDITGPSLSLDTEDVTSHDSTGGWEEHIGTILRSGEVTFDINYIPTHGTHDASTGLVADMMNRTLRNFQLVFPDAGQTTWSFSALVTGMEPSAPVAGRLQSSITLKISGQPTLV
ncbi:MAG: outer capsid protein Hoc [Deltaproteobacteria bacterium]|nr:outer capsid protein Hoc [Deltaproteobacteria bacterium]